MEEKGRSRVGSLLSTEEADHIRHGRVQEQATNWIQEALMGQNVAEVRRKKDQLLAKMREIDDQHHVSRQAALGGYTPHFSSFYWTQQQWLAFTPHRNRATAPCPS